MALAELTVTAREGRTPPADLTGGTITITTAAMRATGSFIAGHTEGEAIARGVIGFDAVKDLCVKVIQDGAFNLRIAGFDILVSEFVPTTASNVYACPAHRRVNIPRRHDLAKPRGIGQIAQAGRRQLARQLSHARPSVHPPRRPPPERQSRARVAPARGFRRSLVEREIEREIERLDE